ncbi:MAG: SagB family peptide dehydrogenase [Candidatus Parabeggiatoa sp.]|nr:SagB family peptide dehydrogenase [Candidatus Parabeggiatoa sp.]
MTTETQPFVLSIKEDISLAEQKGHLFLQSSSRTTMSLENTSQGIQAVLRLLASEGATEEQLTELILQHEGESGLPQFFYYLQMLIEAGLICHTVLWHEVRLATLVPLTKAYPFQPSEPVAAQRYILSRFAYLHQEDEQLVLESPLAHSKMLLHDWRASALLQTLAKPKCLDELCQAFPELSQTAVSLFLSLLQCHHSLDRVDQNGKTEEADSLVQWAFHDLVFQARSRKGRHGNLYGAYHRFEGQIKPLPVVKPPMSDTIISLYKPDIDALKQNDVSFTRVIEERGSFRKQGEQPITVEQLGELLYRTARVRKMIGTRSYERSNRPYPGGGACYELECYLVVNVCEGLPSGLYHYSPREHTLEKLTDRTAEVERLLEDAYWAAAQQGWPQILIILAARFQRVMWRYNSMAYAAILKNVGVLYQNLYLVAIAMGLAPCALGGGDSDLFAAAAGTDYYAETSVGEFIVGSRPDS